MSLLMTDGVMTVCADMGAILHVMIITTQVSSTCLERKKVVLENNFARCKERKKNHPLVVCVLKKKKFVCYNYGN